MTAGTGAPRAARGFAPHDHGACARAALAEAERRAGEDGLRLTPTRRLVLEILLESHRALGAYEVLERLGEGRRAQPPAAYRALDFLVAQGLAHRVESLNAFVACAHPGAAHAPALLICRDCRTVAESPTEAGAGRLAEAARAAGFTIESAVLEAEGLCPACADAAA